MKYFLIQESLDEDLATVKEFDTLNEVKRYITQSSSNSSSFKWILIKGEQVEIDVRVEAVVNIKIFSD